MNIKVKKKIFGDIATWNNYKVLLSEFKGQPVYFSDLVFHG